MKKISLFFALITISLSVFTQTATDALRYSTVNYFGTTRSMTMGGAFGAVGADFSVLSTNPAGLGLYKTSEVSFTPLVSQAQTKSGLFGKSATDDRYNFAFSSAGGVLTAEYPNRLETPGWRFVQFGFGINRLLDFNNRILMEGFNDNNSLLTGYVEYANMYGVNKNSPEELAEKANLIFEEEGTFYSDMPNGGVLQRKSISTEGSMNEVVLSAAANYSDKLYVGITLGFPYIRYYEQSVYTETDVENRNEYFRSFTLREQLETTSTGFNIKAGVIARPVDWLRLGVAYHSPTFFTNMNDVWSSQIDSYFDKDIENKSVSSRLGEFSYELTTPMKAIGSMALLIGQFGMVSAEYQFTDYRDARMRPTGEFYEVNDAIQGSYKAQNIFRFGTEWRYGPFSVRGGYAMYESPFANNINDGERKSYSFGLGYRESDFFMDLGFVQTKMSEKYFLYNPMNGTDMPVAKNDYTATHLMMTLGFKF
jgi:hypothetical protein